MSMDVRELSVSAREVPSRLRLSKWINERCPEWTTLLTDHEVARLTRRPRCLLSALACLGRLPPPRRYRGGKLGWHRQDIERWLASRDASAAGLRRKIPCPARVLRKKGDCQAQGRARVDRHGQ